MLTALAAGAGGCGGDGGHATTVDGGATTDGPPPSRGGPPAASAPWTHAALMRRIAGHRVRVGRRSVAIDPSTVTCLGEGEPAARRNGRPAWTRFRCVQPTLSPAAAAGPDLVFVVKTTGARTFAVVDSHFTTY